MAEEDTPEPLLPASRACVFIGAGFSKPAGVPTTIEFVTDFRESIESESKLTAPFDQIVNSLKSGPDPAKVPPVDVEVVLDALSELREPSRTILAFYQRKSLPVDLPVEAVSELDGRLRQYIRARCLVEKSGLDYLVPLIRLLNAYQPLRIFSTNYDVVLDQFFAGTAFPLVDGFDLKWNPEALAEDSDPTKNQKVLLYRLHGSIIWFQSSSFSLLKLPIKEGEPGIKLLSGESASALVLYPAQKDILQAPFTFLLGELQRRLRDTPWWIVAGYSFRDPALLDCFLEAGSEASELRILLVTPDAEEVFQSNLNEPSHRPGSISPFSSKIAPDRVLRLPYRIEAVLGDIASILLPGYREAVAMEYKSSLREIWGRPTWWYEATLAFAKIGLLDQVISIEQSKSDALKDQLDWRIEFFGLKAIHAVALGRTPEATKSWSEFVKIFETLCGSDQPLSVFNGPNTGAIQLRAEFGYRIGEMYYGLSANNLATIVSELARASSRARRGREGFSRVGALTRIDRALTRLYEYLLPFDLNGVRLGPYREMRMVTFGEQIGELDAYIATNGTGGILPPDYVAQIQKIVVPIEKTVQSVLAEILSNALDGDWDKV